MANTVTPEQEARMFKQAFFNLIDAPAATFEKEGSELMTNAFTRRMMREGAFAPSILPFRDVDNSDLDRALNTEQPFIICEMEAAQPLPKVISFTDKTDMSPFYGNKYLLIFFEVRTPTWIKNVNNLRTYRSDIRGVLVDNALRDLERTVDMKFMDHTNDITGIVPGERSPLTGMQQYIKYPGRLTRSNWVSASTLLPQRSIPNGVFLCNFVTWSEFQRWDRNQMGGDMAEKLILEGGRAFQKAKFGGIDFIVTLKHDLVPNGKIYEFAPANYLGKAGVLQKPTMYVKKDKDMLSMTCVEKIGMTIANTAAVQAVEFEGCTGPYAGDGRIVVGE